MTKQWLIRRAVRMPASRATTAAISSSVCRLPFISASTRPSVTSSTDLAAESWLCSDGTMSIVPISSPAALATLRMRSTGPTRIGSISRNRAASTAPCRDTSSHGCAMATLIAGSAWAALISRWYFSCGTYCPVDSGMFCLGLAALRGPWREHRLDLLQTALAFVRHLAAGRENLVQHLKRRLARSGIAAKQFRQAVDRAFLIQTDQQVLLPHHLLEVGQAHLLIGGM